MMKAISSTSACIFMLFVLLSGQAKAQTGPWNNPLLMATSTDGKFFGSVSVFQDSSGVPSLIHWKGDTLIAAFQWFRKPQPSPTWDRVSVKFSYDLGITWTDPVPAVFDGLPAGYQRPFDPTLVVTEEGKLRMYFSSSPQQPMGLDSTVNTYSAVSSDGITYVFEPGARVDHPSRPVIDPAVIRFKEKWHYLAPAGAPQDGAFNQSSLDGLNFMPLPPLPSDPAHNWTGNLMLESDTTVRFYGSGQGSMWFTESEDAETWGPYQATNLQGGDPAALRISDDNYLIVYVGPPGFTAVAEPDVVKKVRVFPNPTSGLITVESPDGYILALEISDTFGRLLIDRKGLSGSSVTLHVGVVPSGIYYLSVRTDDGVFISKIQVD